MLTYILKRLIFMVPMLLGITIISFLIIHLPPGEPGALGMEMNPKVTKEMRERVGLCMILISRSPFNITYG